MVCFVEIAGFEPASKQGTNMLSTRLSWPSFSCDDKIQATNLTALSALSHPCVAARKSQP